MKASEADPHAAMLGRDYWEKRYWLKVKATQSVRQTA
jgi:hypothetical protein